MAFLEPFILLTLLLGGPLIVLRKTPTTPTPLLFLCLFWSLILFSFMMAYVSNFMECAAHPTSKGCWIWKGLFCGMGIALYAMFLGWFELAWRHKNAGTYIAQPYRWASNVMIIFSLIFGIIFVALLGFQTFSSFLS